MFVILDLSYCSSFAAFFVYSVLLDCSHFIYSATFLLLSLAYRFVFGFFLPFILYCTVVKLLRVVIWKISFIDLCNKKSACRIIRKILPNPLVTNKQTDNSSRNRFLCFLLNIVYNVHTQSIRGSSSSSTRVF